MATTDIQWDATVRLVDLIRTELGDVQVSPYWMGDATEAETIWVSNIETSDITIPVTGGTREIYDDTFDVTIEIGVDTAGSDIEDLHERCSTFIAAIQTVCKTNPELAVDDVALDGVMWCQVTEQRRRTVQYVEGGCGVFAQMVVQIKSRLA